MRFILILALSLSIAPFALAGKPIEFDTPEGHKAFKNLEAFEKEIWFLAYNGQRDLAGRYLVEAAKNHGSRISALFLATEYREGGPIFMANREEANFFQGIYEDLKSKVKDTFFIHFDSDEVEGKHSRLKNAVLSETKKWLGGAYGLLRDRSKDDYESALSNPSFALMHLLELVLEDPDKSIEKNLLSMEEKARALAIIQEGLLDLNDQNLFAKVFKTLSEGYRQVDFLQGALAVAKASPFHSDAEKAELELVIGDNITAVRSPWYFELLKLHEKPSYFSRNFTPFSLVRRAMDDFLNGKKLTEEQKEKLRGLIGQAYIQLQSASLKVDFAKVLKKKGYGQDPSPESRWQLLQILMADESLRASKKAELSKWIKEVMEDYRRIFVLHDGRKKRAYARVMFFECFEGFYDFNPEGAVNYLKKLYELNAKLAKDWTFSLDVLLALKDKDGEFFQTEAQNVLSNHIDRLSEELLRSPERRQKAEGSLISTDGIFNHACRVLSQPPSSSEDKEASRAQRVLEYFARQDELLEVYADRLAPQLGTFLSNHSILDYFYTNGLLNKGPQSLRDAAYQALLTYLVDTKPENRSDYSFKTLADDLFTTERFNSTYVVNKPVAFFQNAFARLSEVRVDYAIQRMWQTMDSREEDVRQEMARQVRSYFNLSPEGSLPQDLDDGAAAGQLPGLRAYLSQALLESLGTNSLPNRDLHEFSEAARLNKLYELFPVEFSVSLGDRVFWDPDAPLTKRCEAFNNILRRRALAGDLENLKAQCQEAIPPSPLLSYVSLAIEMLQEVPKSSYEMYGLMTQMIALEDGSPELVVPSNFILDKAMKEQVVTEEGLTTFAWSPRSVTDLYNMKQYFKIGNHDENAPYVVVDSHIQSPFLDAEGFLYGLLQHSELSRIREDYNYYRLYQCDPMTGYAKWSMILQHNRKEGYLPEYTVGTQYVFVKSGKNKVFAFDKKSGDFVKGINFTYGDPDEKLSYVGAVGDSIFAASVLDKDRLDFNNKATLHFLPQSGTEGLWSLALPQGRGNFKFSIKGSYFVFRGPLSSEKLFVHPSGKSITINGDPTASEDKFAVHIPRTTVDGDALYYTLKPAKKTYQLVHLNLENGQEFWRVPIKGKLTQAPILSIAKDCMFLLHEKDLCVMSVLPQDHGRVFWQVSLRSPAGSFFMKFDHIQVSSDGRYVYGLESSVHKFYRYDVQTGTEENLGKVEAGRSMNFFGTRADGKVFIKPHNF